MPAPLGNGIAVGTPRRAVRRVTSSLAAAVACVMAACGGNTAGSDDAQTRNDAAAQDSSGDVRVTDSTANDAGRTDAFTGDSGGADPHADGGACGMTSLYCGYTISLYCCPQAVACNGDASCRPWLDCISACDGYACRDSCDASLPSNNQAQSSLAACILQNVGDICAPGGDGGVSPTDTGSPVDTGTSTTGTHYVGCWDNSAQNAWSSVCACTPDDTNTGPTSYYGQSCGEATQSPEFCCASPGYPSTGMCVCYNAVTWACVAIGTSQCDCDYLTTTQGMTVISTCNNAPGPDGVPWHCCVTSYGDCTCREQFACASDEREVSDCSTTSAAGVGNAPHSCGTGTNTVSSCSMGVGSTAPDGGTSGSCDPSSCSGTMSACDGDGNCFYCTWYCDGTTCQQSCS